MTDLTPESVRSLLTALDDALTAIDVHGATPPDFPHYRARNQALDALGAASPALAQALLDAWDALDTARADERERIVAWLREDSRLARATGRVPDGTVYAYVMSLAADAIERGDHEETP